MKRPACLRFAVPAVLLVALLGPRLPAAEQRQAEEGRTWVLLIGVNAYEKERPLKFCANDVKELAATFSSIGGLPEAQIKTSIDNDRATIWASVEELLGNAREGDTVIVFFSGHGFLNATKNEVVLAARDFDRNTKGVEVEGRGPTGIALSDLRTAMMGSKATHRLLLLDACFAGAIGEDSQAPAIVNRPPTSPAKGNPPPEKSRGVYCIASCMRWEKSIDDPQLEMGRFTYWMNQGLCGGADVNGDGEIRSDELFDFARERMERAQKVSSAQPRQEPSRLVTTEVHGNPCVLKLHPQLLPATMGTLANMLQQQIQHCGTKFEKMEVREFVSPHGNIGNLGLFAKNALEEHLLGIDAHKGLGVEPRSGQTAGMACIGGTVQRYHGTYVFQCSLKREEQAYATAVAVCRDKAADALAGESGCLRANGAWLEQHPIADREAGAKYGVRIFVHDKERPQMKVHSIPNTVFVGLEPGENYKIGIYNRTNEAVFVRVFIDGLNTRGSCFENPSEAKYWSLGANRGGALSAWTEAEKVVNGKLQTASREFLVIGDIRRSPAWQAEGNDKGKIGQITVMFYERNTHSGKPKITPEATAFGRPREDSYALDPYGVPTKLLATYTIHYVAPKSLADPTMVSKIPTD